MWITVFATTFAAALGFAVAAIWRSSKEFGLLLAEIADTDDACKGLGGSALDDDSLLLDRMRLLHINVGEMARAEPSLLRSLSIRCWGCESNTQCRRDLCTASANEEWRDYCPNASMLKAISALYGERAHGQMVFGY
jgi:uncharacterized protein DUF6455